ncbi:MAG: transporter substrate-binding domain-containing protein [Desulfamplus sp.]|nr:transporter substrate-binding domain-containing protein [Desulfamplus sp.]
MKNVKNLKMLFVLFSVLFFDVDASSKETIIWGHGCIPPLYLCEGDNVRGVAANIENIVFENLPDYKHERLNSNLERILESLKTQDKFCCSAIAKNPEREEFAYFSIPAAIVPPIHIFIRKDDHAAFGGADVVSLDKTLEKTNLKFGYPSARSFGSEIDAIIKAHANAPHLSETYSSDIVDQQIELLINRRIDYTIGGYFALKIAAKKLGVQDEILPIRISEKEEYLALYFVCPKNGWGRAMVEKINAILKKELPTKRYFEYFKPYYDNGTEDEFKQQYENILIKPIVE